MKFILIILLSTLSAIYIYYHLHYLMGVLILFIILLLIVLHKFFNLSLTYNINFKVSKLIIIFILVHLILLFYFSIDTYYHYPSLFIDKKAFEFILDLLVSHIFHIISSIILFTFYFLVSYEIGEFLLIKCLKIKNIAGKESIKFIKFTIGLGVITQIFFLTTLFTQYSQLKLIIFALLLMILLYLLTKFNGIKSLVKVIYNKIYIFNNTKIETNLLKLSLYIIIIAFTNAVLIKISQPFIAASDGLRTYMTIPISFVESGYLPHKYVNLTFPYFAEIMISPAFITNISIAKTTFYLLSITSVWGFYLLMRYTLKFTRFNSIIISSLLILFPPFLSIIFHDFKIDLILLLYQISILILFINFKHRYNYLIIIAFLSAILLTIKPTTIIISLFVYIFIIIDYFKNEPFSKLIKMITITLILHMLIFLPWIYTYMKNTEYLGFINSKLSYIFILIFNPTNFIFNSCLANTLKFEQLHQAHFDYSIIGYFNILKSYFLNDEINYNYNLDEIGIITIILIISFFVFIFKKKNINKIELISIFGFIMWFISTPVYPWYGGIYILLICAIGLNFILVNNIINKNTIFIILIILFSTATLVPARIYILPNFNNKKIDSLLMEKFDRYEEHTEVAKFLNESNNKIYYLTGMYYLNIVYGIDNYYERVRFIDYFNYDIDENQLMDKITRNEPTYLVDNTKSAFDDHSCIKTYSNNLNTILEKLDYKPVLENDYYTVYKVN